MVSKVRVSGNNVTTDAPVVLYSNSPEATDLNPNFVKIIPGTTIGPQYVGSGSLTNDAVPSEILIELDEEDLTIGSEETSNSENGSASSGFQTPTLSDITLVSTEVIYDASGNPSVTAVFKVKNTSGTNLKGLNAKVEKIW